MEREQQGKLAERALGRLVFVAAHAVEHVYQRCGPAAVLSHGGSVADAFFAVLVGLHGVLVHVFPILSLPTAIPR